MTEAERVISGRMKFFNSFCSKDLSMFLSRNRNWNEEQLKKILSLARNIADANGRIRCWIIDFQEAIRQLREKGEDV